MFQINAFGYFWRFINLKGKILRKLLLGLILILSVPQFAFQNQATPVSYSTGFTFPDISKDELFARAKTWFEKQVDDPNSIMQIEDKEVGQLIGQAMLGYTDTKVEYGVQYHDLNGIINYTITLDISEGMIVITLSDFIHRAFPYGSKGTRNSMGLITTADTFSGKLYGYNASAQKSAWNKIKLSIDEFANDLLESLRIEVEKKTGGQ